MKTLFLFLLFILPFSVNSKEEKEQLFVSEISGDPILMQSGREKIQISKSQQITKKDILIIGEGSTLILLEPLNCNRYTLKGPYTGNIAGYIKRNEQNSVRHISKTYFNFLFARMLSPKKTRKEQSETSSTSALRKGDSILAPCENISSLRHITDSLTIYTVDTLASAPIDACNK